MERRDFLKGLAVLAASTYVGCNKTEPQIIQSGDKTFLIKDQILTHEQGSPISKIGVIADPHGHRDNMFWAVKQLEAEDVDAYLLLGDLSHKFGDKQGERDDIPELSNVIHPTAYTGKLVLALPGNHENSAIYTKYIKDCREDMFKNVINMETTPVADLEGITFVGFGGLSDPRFCNSNGFLRTQADYEKFGFATQNVQRMANKKKQPLFLATHEPNKYQTKNGLDTLKFKGGQHVGLDIFTELSKALNASRGSGHIHEGYGIITPDEQPIKPGEKVDVLHMNPGAVFDYVFGLEPSVGVIEVCENNKLSGYLIQR